MGRPVVDLPVKREFSSRNEIQPEQPWEKRQKFDDPQPKELHDTAMELQSEEAKSELTKSAGDSSTKKKIRPKFLQYCDICHGHVGHTAWACPYKSRGIGIGCMECYGPCKTNDPEHEQIEMIKYCIVCAASASHWGDECPVLARRDESDSDVSEEGF